jgi:hypothetical protein
MSTSTPNNRWSRVFAVVFAIVLPLSTIAAWAVSTVTNTDRWVATLHPLASEPVVTQYIAEEGARTLVHDLHVEKRIRQALPSGAAFLATTITTELQSTIATALSSALATHAFQTVWDRENRFTHQLAVDVLEGHDSTSISRARDVVLNITPAIDKAINHLDAQGITFLDPLKKRLHSDRVLVLHLLGQRELQRAQYYFHLATTLEWALPFLTLLLALLVVFTAVPRRVGLRRLSLSVLVSSAVAYCLLRIGIALAAPLAPSPPAVNKAILQAVTSFLAGELLALAVAGGLGLLVHWFTGPSERAISSRAYLAHAARAVGGSVLTRSKELVRTNWQGWSTENQHRLLEGLRVVDVLAGALVVALLLWAVSSVTWLVVVLALGALWYWISRRAHHRLSGEDGHDSTGPR